MNHYKIFKNGEVLDESITSADEITALADWLDAGCIEFEMIETDDDGIHYAETTEGYFEIKS